MKNEQEKSDLFVVAMKPANKPGRPGAEAAEPRERTEGNTGEQHMRRTQSREKRVPEARLYAELPMGLVVDHPRWEPGA